MRDTPNNETVIVEYGFADSSGDDVNQIKNNWENLAEAVTKAIVEYAGGTYVAPAGSNYYTVKSGDSLWSISKKFGISVTDLKNANNLTGNLLSIGQNLMIPGLNEQPSGGEYVVKKGDSLYAIAQKYNTTVDNLKSINNLTTDALSIGQIIKLPGTSVATPSPQTGNTYTVKSGDTLYKIAQANSTTVDKLKELNNLSSNTLAVGQVLKLPTSSTTSNNVTYTVKKGDSLYSIAREFGTTVSAISKLNNLSTTTLSIGQKLLLP